MNILFKYATRSRPDLFKETLNKWYSMLSGKHEYQFIVSVDEDDLSMNNDQMKEFMQSKPGLTFHAGQSKSKIEAINADMEGVDFDILVVVSDDMIPQKMGFDDIIVGDMMQNYPELDGALSYWDGVRSDNLITITIMGKKLYDKFGYIYNPEYKSLWCDNEFTDVVNEMGKVTYIRRLLIKHEWVKYNNDELGRRNNVFLSLDKQVYNYRKMRGFQHDKKGI